MPAKIICCRTVSIALLLSLLGAFLLAPNSEAAPTVIPGSQINRTWSLSSGKGLGINVTTNKATLDIGGSLSGRTLTLSDLRSCAGLQTSSTGAISCGSGGGGGGTNSGNVLTLGDARYVRKAGDTMTGALTINLSSGTLGLDVKQKMSGASLHVSGLLSTSGSLQVPLGTAAAPSMYFKGSPNTGFFSETAGRIDVSIGGTAKQKWNSTAFILASDMSLYFNSTTDVTTGTADTRIQRESAGVVEVIGTISGSSLVVSGPAAITGTLTLGRGATSKPGDLRLFTTGGSNYARIYGAGTSRTETLYVGGTDGIYNFSNYLVGIGTTSPKARLDVVGAMSGTRLTINGSGSVTLGQGTGVTIRQPSTPTLAYLDFRNGTTSKLMVDKSGYLQSLSGVTVVSRPSMGSFGGDFTFTIKRDGSNNFGNGAMLKFTDNETSAYIKWVSSSFSQGVMDLEFHNANGKNMSMPSGGGIYVYNPVINSQDISIVKVPSQTLSPGGGTWPVQATFKFDPQTFAGTSPLTVTRAVQLYINSAPITGVNMTIGKSTAAQFDTGGANKRGLIIRGGNSQSGGLLELTNTGGTILSAFTASGGLALGGQHVKKGLLLEAYGTMSGSHLHAENLLSSSGAVAGTRYYASTADSIGNPAYSWGSDANTGILNNGADTIGFSAGATLIAEIDGTGLNVLSNMEATGSISASHFNINSIGVGTDSSGVATLHAFGGTSAYVQPTGTEEFYDGFDEAGDTTLASHTPNIGTSWTLLINNSGTMQVDASQSAAEAPATTANVGSLYTADVSMSTADYEVAVTANVTTTADDVAAIAARVQDANNMYLFKFSATLANNLLQKRVGGTWTTLATATEAVTAGDTVRLRVVGNEIVVLRNQRVVANVTDTDITGAGEAGMGIGNISLASDDQSTVWELNDFTVKPYVAAGGTPVAVFENGNVGIDTLTPGSQLSVSGSAIIGVSIGSQVAKATLDVKGTISGSQITVSKGAGAAKGKAMCYGTGGVASYCRNAFGSPDCGCTPLP